MKTKKNRFTKSLSILFLTLIYANIYGQMEDFLEKDFNNIIPPSTEAASLGLFGQFQVGHFTGTADIYIPLYELRGRHISQQIALSYNSSGILVEEISPWVGANWGLIAGGVISQTVKGKPDNLGVWIFPLPEDEDPDQISYNDLKSYLSNNRDAEPDVFTFNFNGYSGKILFDSQQNAISVPRQPLLITPMEEGNEITGWKVVDDKGFSYYFGTLTHKGSYNNPNTLSKSWHLDRIVTPDQQETISFSYDVFSTSYKLNDNAQSVMHGGIQSFYSIFDIIRRDLNVYESNAYLTNIKSSMGEVVFESVSRSDDQISNLRQLDRIKAYNTYGTLVKDLKFTFDNTGERLFLRKIEELADQKYIDLYQFEYIQGYLPERFKTTVSSEEKKYAIDYWGYYNGKNTNEHLIPQAYEEIQDFSPADRLPDLDFAQRGTLEKIIYPTGGCSKFYYELNKTDPRPGFYGANIPTSSDYEVGGLRIAKIEDIDNDGNTQTRSYDYIGQGELISEPIYCYYFQSNRPEDQSSTIAFRPVATISSNSQAYLKSINGSHIVYPKVKEIYGANGENGYTVFEYSLGGLGGSQYTYNPPFNPYDGSYAYKSGKLIRKTDYDADNHKLKENANVYSISTELVEVNKGLRVMQSLEKYVLLGGISSRVDEDEFYTSFYNIVSEWQYKSSDIVRIYDPQDETKYVETINTYNYENPEHQQLTSQTTYNSSNQLVETKYIYPSDQGSGAPTQMYDENNANFRHMLSNIVEKEVEVANVPVSKSHITYIYDSGKDMVLPYEAEVYSTGTSVSYSIFNEYDDYGNLVEQYKEDDIHTAYLWGYSNTLLIAKAENAKHTEIAYIGFEDDSDLDEFTYVGSIYTDGGKKGEGYLQMSGSASITSKSLPAGDYKLEFWAQGTVTVSGGTVTALSSSSPDANGWIYYEKNVKLASTGSVQFAGTTYIDEIRLYPMDAQMTSYTYKPLVGITSQTDARGYTTFYKYDNFGRLENIKDEDGNIVEEYKYNYSTPISPTSLSFPEGVATKNLTVNTDKSWTITNLPSFISSVSPSSGTGEATVAVTCSENSGSAKTGEMLFTYGDITKTIQVFQEEASVGPPSITITIEPEDNEVSMINGYFTITWETNFGTSGNVTIESSPLTYQPTDIVEDSENNYSCVWYFMDNDNNFFEAGDVCTLTITYDDGHSIISDQVTFTLVD